MLFIIKGKKIIRNTSNKFFKNYKKIISNLISTNASFLSKKLKYLNLIITPKNIKWIKNNFSSF